MTLAEWSIGLGIFGGTFVSEDGAFLSALTLGREGKLPMLAACLASGSGIWVGDLGLYFLGRFGRRFTWLRNFSDRVIKRAEASIPSGFYIFFARFIPGTRLPVFVAAGLRQTPLAHFALLTAAAVTMWTALGFWLMDRFLGKIPTSTLWFSALGVVGGAAVVVMGAKWSFKKFRSVRLAAYRWQRWRYFEFWPGWAFYTPLVIYYFYLALRHFSLRLPVYANPGLPNGGVIGESKSFILSKISPSRLESLKYLLLDLNRINAHEALAQARQFMEQENLSFPIILKPDVGHRGSGVSLLRGSADMQKYLSLCAWPVILQQYCADREEVGVNYVRHPLNARGKIVGITRKVFPKVVGDGQRSLEELILSDPRARFMAKVYFRRHQAILNRVLASGEELSLVESGNHCQGTIFENGQNVWSADLEQKLDEIAQGIPGFFVGRFDLRFSTVEELRAGRGFKIIEVNGGAGEATHIYDSAMTLGRAYRVLFSQMRILFEIGKFNRQRGSIDSNVIDAFFEYRKTSRLHPPTT